MLYLWEGVEWEYQDIDGHTVKAARRIYGQSQEWSLWGTTVPTVLQKNFLLYVDWAAIFREIVTELKISLL